jgi:CHAT domain-containing protein/tetratricopeptide (TPR) repeat protein
MHFAQIALLQILQCCRSDSNSDDSERHPSDHTGTEQRAIKRGLAISLAVSAMLTSMPWVRAEPVMIVQSTIEAESSNQSEPDLQAMIEKADRLHSQGDYAAAAAIWQQLLTISEKLLGPDHPDVALSLNNLALLLSDQGQYSAAEPLYRRALAIRERALGSDHPDTAISLNNLAEHLRDQGQYSAAEPLYRRSLEIREKVLGPDHPGVAISLNNLAATLSDQGQYNAADPLYRRSLEIREKVLGPYHPDVARGLNNLAVHLRDQGQYSAAEPLYRRALAIRERALGSDHLDVALTLNNLAALLSDQGQFSAAEPLHRRSLAILEKVHGPDHPSFALGLSNLAALLRNQGQYNAAELLHRRSLAIREKALGSDHPVVAISLNNLAGLLRDLGQYSAAERFLRRSLEIREKSLGPDHPDVAVSLNNLASLLSVQGQHITAEPFYRRSLAIREKVFGPDHPDVAHGLNNLALHLRDQGQFSVAEPLYRRSLAILEKALGPDHPDVAIGLNNLAALLSVQGRHNTAEPLYRRSLAIREKALGPDHPEVALGLNNLALHLLDQGQYSAAEALYRRSLTIRKKALGPDHLGVALGLNNLALHLHDQAQHSSAITSLNESLAIESSWLIRELPLLHDQARFAQLNRIGNSWQVPFGWIAAHLPAAKVALEIRLNRQGLLQEIEQRQALLLNAPGIDPAKVQQLQSLTQQLASVTLPADRRPVVRQQRDALQSEIYRLQPDLEIQSVTVAQVASALPADGVLVEIQRYRPIEGRQPRSKRWAEPQYIALVLKPNGDISSVPLGPAAAIDATVHKALSASAQDQSDAAALWAQLSDQLLKPLLPQLSGSRQWFLSPDGELNRVPFAALPAPQQPHQPLAAAVQLRVLTTGRDLVRLQNSTTRSQASLVMANPSFDRAGRGTALASANGNQPGGQRRSADLGSTRWKPLPGTEREGQQVASLLGARLLSGPAATATALKQQQSPRVLHVATHGFFLADQNTPPSDPLRVVQEEAAFLSALRQEGPLLRSGLVLAGANQPAADPNDDGHLTAAEILTMNLKGTELVVLSACSTGQGEVRTGEGVYGLQRALTVAGARSTLLSLWKVDDDATAVFMARFYQRLKAGEGRASALAAVQSEFRSGAVTSLSGADWSQPYYWAAWQLTGDWGPIPGL